MRRFNEKTKGRRRAIAITITNVVISTFYSLAGLVSLKAVMPAGFVATDATMVFAMYAAARTLSITVLTFAAILMRSLSGLIVLGVLVGIIQFSDAAIGVYQHDLGKTLGPLLLALLQFYAIYILEKSTRSES